VYKLIKRGEKTHKPGRNLKTASKRCEIAAVNKGGKSPPEDMNGLNIYRVIQKCTAKLTNGAGTISPRNLIFTSVTFERVAVISAKNHKRQHRKRQSVTAKREKSQTPKVLTAILTLPNLT